MTDEKEPDSPPAQSTATYDSDLPNVRSHIPYRVWLVQGLVFLERAASYGASQPWQNYLQLSPDDPVRPGALGLGQARAILIIYVWLIYIYCTPLAGGLLADCWLGRRRTIQLGFIVYALGLAVLTGTAFSQRSYGTGGLPGFIVGTLLIGAGVGAVRPNMTVFLIDQYTEEEPQIVQLKNGSSAKTSRELTIQYIYNVNYWVINVGGLAGIVTTLTERHAGFGFAYLISLCLMVIAAALYQVGYSHFIKAPPTGNVITSVLGALRRRRHRNFGDLHQSGREGQHPAQQEDAATFSEGDEILLRETKAALKACLLFLPFPALMLCIDIMDSGLVAQAGSMQTHGLPNDIMYNLNPIAVMILLPFFQGWLYPFLARRRLNFTPQHRIGAGLLCAALAIAYTAGTQHLIYISGPCFTRPLKCLSGGIPNDVSVGIQTPTYVFLALGEILAIVAGTELAYTRAPENMKSIVQAVLLLFSALGAVIGVEVSFAAEDPNMVIVYGSIAGLLAVVTVAFEVAVVRKIF